MPQQYPDCYENWTRPDLMLPTTCETQDMDNGQWINPNFQRPCPNTDGMICGNPPTAFGKNTSLIQDFNTMWEENTPMKQWTTHEVINWINQKINGYNYDYGNMLSCTGELFNVDGCTLSRMTEADFVNYDQLYGPFIYKFVQDYKNSHKVYDDNYDLPPFCNIRQPSPIKEEIPYIDNRHMEFAPSHSDIDSDNSENSIQDKSVKVITTAGGRRPGRPPKVPKSTKRNNKEKKCGRLWEFIRDLLLKPEYCPSLICWENHDEGTFRFVRSDKVAELWGTIKENPKMTYEKLSRAMRYYYKSQVLQPVLGRRLVYKFGPTAKGWRTSNPNFRDTPK